MTEDRQLLVFRLLFTEIQVTHIQNNRECAFTAEDLTGFGMVQINCGANLALSTALLPRFVLPDYLVNRLTEAFNNSQQMKTFVLKDIFPATEYRVTRLFLSYSKLQG